MTHPSKTEDGVPSKVTAVGNIVGCYIDSRLWAEIGSQTWHHSSTQVLPQQASAAEALFLRKTHLCSGGTVLWLTPDFWSPQREFKIAILLLWILCEKAQCRSYPDMASLTLLRWTESLGFEYFWDTIRGLAGTPPTPLNVAVLCHLTAVLISLPYPDREARWKQKRRQEDFNIALRSHTICPFHEQADGRGGNASLHYRQTILRSLVSLGICRVPASVISPDIVNLPRFGLRPMIAQL